MKRFIQLGAIALATGLLAACGGGGGSGETSQSGTSSQALSYSGDMF